MVAQQITRRDVRHAQHLAGMHRLRALARARGPHHQRHREPARGHTTLLVDRDVPVQRIWRVERTIVPALGEVTSVHAGTERGVPVSPPVAGQAAWSGAGPTVAPEDTRTDLGQPKYQGAPPGR